MILTQALIDKLAAWQAEEVGHWYYLGFGDAGAFDSEKMRGVPEKGLEIMTLWIGDGPYTSGVRLDEAEYFGDYELLLLKSERSELRRQLAQVEWKIAKKEAGVA